MRLILFVSLCFAFSVLSAEPEGPDPLRSAALSGDAEACFKLGNEYFYAENGRNRNETLAAFWYKKAADAGIPEAIFNYALCLETGRGVKQNRFEAFKWHQKAAALRYNPARYRLSVLFATGIRDEKGNMLIERSPASQLELLELLNIENFEAGELALAERLLARGSSYDDKARAYKILRKVVARKEYHPSALRMLADCRYGGYGCEQNIAKMLRLLERAAERGDPESAVKLGFLHENGQAGLAKDPEKAFEYYKKASDAGYPVGYFKYGEAIFNKGGDAKQLNEALRLFNASAKAGYPPAMLKLGLIFADGLRGVHKDKKAAAIFFFEAGKRGNGVAMFRLASMFEKGDGVKRDESAAFYWYLMAAGKGHPAAQRKAAIAYFEGRGVDRSFTKGRMWLERAAKSGDLVAIQLLPSY